MGFIFTDKLPWLWRSQPIHAIQVESKMVTIVCPTFYGASSDKGQDPLELVPSTGDERTHLPSGIVALHDA
ncbi:MAG TPA: hypothetical protein PK076_09260 [Saprospiraceae bacterium]|nr:hypothetical protein [Saprospiraceae bacterium]HQW56302.1 hypothetical protein [Saprospiraceae bacterium]